MNILASSYSSLGFRFKDDCGDVQFSTIIKQIGVINATMTCTAAFHFMDTEVILHSPTSETVVLCKDKQDICLFIFKTT